MTRQSITKDSYGARYSHVSLLGELDFSNALASSDHVLVLDTHDTTTPVATLLLVVVELFAEGDRELLEILEVLFVNLSKGNAGSGLHVTELAKVGLSTDEAVRDILSAAKGGQVNDSLDGVNVVSDNNHLGNTLFNKGGDVVETKLDVDRLGSLASAVLLSSSLKSKLLLLTGFGHVLGEELKELGS